MAGTDRLRLDNVGTFYAAEAARGMQTVFRFTATLDEEVRPDALQEALDGTVGCYPGFNVCLRKGFFWHHLEPMGARPLVQPDSLPVCAPLHAGPGSPLFRVSFRGRCVFLEVSHIISDGRGTLTFFKELICRYFEVRAGQPQQSCRIDRDDSVEDGFAKHYDRDKAASTPTRRAYRIAGERDAGDPAYLEYRLPASEVHAAASGHGVSVTSLVIAAIICALRDTRPASEAQRSIRLTVPVDLRRAFPTDTMRNFFGLVTVTSAGDADEPLEEVAADVQRQLRRETAREQLEKRMNRMIALERNPLLKIVPVGLKDLALRLSARFAARYITAAVSSLGRISFGGRADEHVRSVGLLTTTYDLSFVVCTFADGLSIGISTIYADRSPIDRLYAIFEERGIRGRIEQASPAQKPSPPDAPPAHEIMTPSEAGGPLWRTTATRS